MVRDNEFKDNEARIATGIDDDEELSEKPTLEEVQRGEYTRVITLRDKEPNRD